MRWRRQKACDHQFEKCRFEPEWFVCHQCGEYRTSPDEPWVSSAPVGPMARAGERMIRAMECGIDRWAKTAAWLVIVYMAFQLGRFLG